MSWDIFKLYNNTDIDVDVRVRTRFLSISFSQFVALRHDRGDSIIWNSKKQLIQHAILSIDQIEQIRNETLFLYIWIYTRFNI